MEGVAREGEDERIWGGKGDGNGEVSKNLKAPEIPNLPDVTSEPSTPTPPPTTLSGEDHGARSTHEGRHRTREVSTLTKLITILTDRASTAGTHPYRHEGRHTNKTHRTTSNLGRGLMQPGNASSTAMHARPSSLLSVSGAISSVALAMASAFRYLARDFAASDTPRPKGAERHPLFGRSTRLPCMG